MDNPTPQVLRDQIAWRMYVRCATPLCRVLRRTARTLVSTGGRLNRLSGELLFVPLPGDIYIASYPRSGTTWLQMIVYQMMTDGSMNFSHISEVIPFFERSLAIGRDLDRIEQIRVFKTHLRYSRLPKGECKYIYIVRDGRDVLVSYFHFHKSHLRYKGSFDTFFERFLRGRVGYGSWFEHVAEWVRHSNDENVLFLTYEELVRDLRAWLPRIAEFCGVNLAPQRLEAIAERCSFGFMKEHESKFDFMNEVAWERGFEKGRFLRQGTVGAWSDELTPMQIDRFRQIEDRNGDRRRTPLAATR